MPSAGKKKTAAEKRRSAITQGCIEVGFGFYLLACMIILVAKTGRLTFGIPFLILFMVGFFYVGILTLVGQLQSVPKQAPTALINRKKN